MKIREMLAAIQGYPNIQADLELARDELGRTQAALQESQNEYEHLLDNVSTGQFTLQKLRREVDVLSSVLHTFRPALQHTDALQQFYECVAPHLDNDGFRLYNAAKALTGFDLYGSFPYEDARSQFEEADGHQLMEYLKAYCFGAVDWDIVPGTSYESASLGAVDTAAQEYQVFEKALYERVLRDMGFGDLLSPEAPQKLQNKETKGRDAHAR